MIKQRRVLLANPINTASMSERKPRLTTTGQAKDIASGPNLLVKAL